MSWRGAAWNSNTPLLKVLLPRQRGPGFSDACLARDAIGFFSSWRSVAAVEPECFRRA